MRYLGLDLGTKTLGISMSDKTGIIASNFKTLRFAEKDYNSTIEPLKEIINEYDIKCIVLGLPKNMNNSLGFRSEETLEYKKLLEKNINIDVVLQDERLTTMEANNYMLEADISRKKRKEKKDELAASIILQSYLDRK